MSGIRAVLPLPYNAKISAQPEALTERSVTSGRIQVVGGAGGFRQL